MKISSEIHSFFPFWEEKIPAPGLGYKLYGSSVLASEINIDMKRHVKGKVLVFKNLWNLLVFFFFFTYLEDKKDEDEDEDDEIANCYIDDCNSYANESEERR